MANETPASRPHVEQASLWITDLEILRLHYAETLREWRRRFTSNREKIAKLTDRDPPWPAVIPVRTKTVAFPAKLTVAGFAEEVPVANEERTLLGPQKHSTAARRSRVQGSPRSRLYELPVNTLREKAVIAQFARVDSQDQEIRSKPRKDHVSRPKLKGAHSGRVQRSIERRPRQSVRLGELMRVEGRVRN